MTEMPACPLCGGALALGVGDIGLMQACPHCGRPFVLAEGAGPGASAFVVPGPSAGPGDRRRVAGAPRGLTAVAGLGILGCCVGLMLAVLAGLACTNAFVPAVKRGVERALPMPAAGAPATRTHMIVSSIVLAALSLVFLAIVMGLLLRREAARRAFSLAAWLVFAVFAGEAVGVFVLPSSTIKPWTLLVFAPAAGYFWAALRYLHRPSVKALFD